MRAKYIKKASEAQSLEHAKTLFIYLFIFYYLFFVLFYVYKFTSWQYHVCALRERDSYLLSICICYFLLYFVNIIKKKNPERYVSNSFCLGNIRNLFICFQRCHSRLANCFRYFQVLVFVLFD